MRKTIFLSLSVALLLMAVIAFSASSQNTQPQTAQVTAPDDDADSSAVPKVHETHWVLLQEGSFWPATVEISPGDSIEWVNLEETTQLVAIEGCGADLILPPGGRGSYTFWQQGEFSYLYGEGSVVVR